MKLSFRYILFYMGIKVNLLDLISKMCFRYILFYMCIKDKETMLILTRKIQIVPVGDREEINRVYGYIRDGMKAQNIAMNHYMSAMYISNMEEISKEDRAELNRLYTRISSSKKGSAYAKDIEFAKGLPAASDVGMAVRQDFSKSCKNGLMYGKVSLPTYRSDNPLIIHSDYVRLRSTNPHKDNGLYHEYSNHEEFLQHLYKNDLNVFIKFANGITFKIIFGRPNRSMALRKEFQMIFEEFYKVCGSSIQISRKKLILNLAIEIPEEKQELDEGTVVGVDLGIAIPAYCALNTDKYKRLSVGCAEDFIRVKTKIQSQKRSLQRHLKMTSGGHGRKKKMKPMERLSKYESNFVKTYNHMVSKRVVDFAINNRAKYINIENLEGFDTKSKFLKGWSHYQLQQDITYKAQKYGIVVRKINPYHTSQICSCCGNYDEGQRVSQSKFICKGCGQEMNADFNAARNIAMSTDFSNGKKTVAQLKEQAEKAMVAAS